MEGVERLKAYRKLRQPLFDLTLYHRRRELLYDFQRKALSVGVFKRNENWKIISQGFE